MQHQQGQRQGGGVRDLEVNPLVLVCMYLPWAWGCEEGFDQDEDSDRTAD